MSSQIKYCISQARKWYTSKESCTSSQDWHITHFIHSLSDVLTATLQHDLVNVFPYVEEEKAQKWYVRSLKSGMSALSKVVCPRSQKWYARAVLACHASTITLYAF